MNKEPVTRELFDEVMVPNYAPGKVIPVRGEGSRIWDQDGRVYVDLQGGIAVTCLGHSHPGLIGALQEQAEKIWHLSNVMTNEPALRLAKTLCDLTFAERVFFANSGGEANEAAFKLARRYAWEHYGPDKHEIIAFRNAFHGRTLFTVSVGGQPKYLEGFEPAPAGIHHAEYNNLDSVRALISKEKTCAVVVEPIQGEGGIRPGSEEFIRGLRQLADENDLMLVFDEVQCGVARTGKLYAYEHYGIAPNIMASAKGIGGGFPLGACLATEKAARGMGFGTHGSTYGGNPLAMAAGMAVMDAVANDEFLAEVTEKGERLRSRLEQFIGNYPELFELVRGKGLMLGVKMKVESRPFFVHLRDNHQLLTVAAGDNTLRVLPPLVAGDAEFDEFFDKLSAGAASYTPVG